MITLNLLHPIQSIPVQSWTFEAESVIRIGRAKDSDVVVHSAVVSRLHVELHREPTGWEVLSLGTNGTYLNGEKITRMAVVDGMIIRLGTSGPKIQIWIGSVEPHARLKANIGKNTSSVDSSTDGSQPIPTFLTAPKPPQGESKTRRED